MVGASGDSLSGQAPAGWYPDPSGSPRQRYFDGAVWTEHYHDSSPSGAAARAGAGGAYGVAQPSNMGPLDYWKSAMLEKYADFSGRARRAEYWWTTLINLVGMVILYAILLAISTTAVALVLVVYLALLVPSLALGIRRLHDTDKSGWWLLIGLVPFGGIVLLVFMFTDGTRGSNNYGPSPKY